MNGIKKSFAPFLTAFACAAAVSVGAVFCVVTAFDVPVTSWLLIGCLVGLSAVFAFLCGCRHGWIGLVVIALAAAGVACYYRLSLFASVSVAVEAVTRVYASAFESLQTVTLLHTVPGATGTAFFAAFGALLSLITAWTVRGQNTLWLAAVCGVLPLVVCLIILQSVPAAWAVLLLVGALALLLLTQQLRRANARAGGMLALRMFLPLAVLMLGLYAAFPQSGYARSAWSDSLRPKVNEIADKLTIFRANETTGQVQFVSPFSPSTLGGRVWDSSVKKADLGRVGPQRLSGQHVMRVYSDTAQTYYLRACSLGVYGDNQWLAVDESSYALTETPGDVFLVRGSYEEKQVRIETDMKSSVYYTPYMLTELPENAEPIRDAYVKNPLQETQYCMNWAANYMQTGPNAATEGEYRAFVYEAYTQIPDELKQMIAEYLPVTSYSLDGLSALNLCAVVKTIVQDGKTYNLNTPRVPEGEDFVAWFLKESDTGYCVHFATAAAVLLRYYGVPARYVTGYLVDANAGEWTDVTQDDAHAWVEYYNDEFGWVVFDPTPAAPDVTDEPDEPAEPAEPETQQNGGMSETPEKENSESETDKTSNIAVNIDKNPNNYGNNDGENDQTQQTRSASGWLLALVWCLLGLAAVLFGWRMIVLSARAVSFTRGSTNRRAVHYYRHIALLARLGKTEVPEELEQLAQKARFSQHKLTDDELEQFAQYADSLTQTLVQQAAPVRRVIYRMLYVLQ